MVDDGVFGHNAVHGKVVFFEAVIDPDYNGVIFGYEMLVRVIMNDGSIVTKNVLMKNYKDVFDDFMKNDIGYTKRVVVSSF